MSSPLTLPRTYWCHLDLKGVTVDGAAPDLMALTAAEALDWIRQGVRAMVAELEREEFGRAWAWLGDHRGAETVRRELRAGRPYAHTERSALRTWTWSAHPVRPLQTLDLGHKPRCIPQRRRLPRTERRSRMPRDSTGPTPPTTPCPVCVNLDATESEARRTYDHSRESDIRVLRARHADRCPEGGGGGGGFI